MTAPMLRVLHIIRPEPAGSIGGADLHVLELAAAQLELELCQPLVLAPGASADFRLRASRLNVTIIDPLSRPGGRRFAAVLPAGAGLIHSHGYEADFLAVVLPLLKRAWRDYPVVMTCHGVIAPNLRHRIMNRIDLACMRRAAVLIAVSKSGERFLRGRLPDQKVRTIPNGVRPPVAVNADQVRIVRAELGAYESNVLVGFVGRLSAEKRPDLFVRVAETLIDQDPQTRFAMIGGGALQNEIECQIGRSAAASRVVSAGLRHDMDAVFSAIDVLLVPSDVENTPRALIEALIRGVPVVVTAAGDMPSLVACAASAVVVDRGDVAGMAAAIGSLIEPVRFGVSRPDFREAGHHHWTVAEMARSVDDVYRAAAGARGAKRVR